MTATGSPIFAFATTIILGASLLRLAAPFRFQFGIPGLQADFSANLGGVPNFGNLAVFGSGSSGSGSSSPGRVSWPWSPQVTANSRRQSGGAATSAATSAASATLSDASPASPQANHETRANAVSSKSAMESTGGSTDGFGPFGPFGPFSLWGDIPFAGGSTGSSVRGGAGSTGSAGSASAGATNQGLDPEDGIVFNLFTRKNNRAVRLFARDISTIKGSTFNPKRKTKMVIHGYGGNTKEGSAGDLLKDILLRVGDMNVILVDWFLVDPHIYPIDVSTTVPMVGAVIAALIKTLVAQAGADESDFHLIGHSLGAHIAGAAGSIALGPSSKGVITGLDPAGPLYEGVAEGRRLDPSDAGFVEAVHTDGGYLGIVQPVGHVDWYINSGMHRHPDCGADILGVCSHCFAFEVFAHALVNRSALVGTKCDSLDNFRAGGCNGNQRLAMNIGVSRKSRGSFYIDTKLRPSEGLRGVGSRLISPIINYVSRRLLPGQVNDPSVRC